MTVRKTVTVPAVGSPLMVEVAGKQLIVESGAHDTPGDVPTLHMTTPDSDPLPAYPQAKFISKFNRFYVKGTAASAGTSLYLLIVTECGIEAVIPNTVIHA